jgi:hypothetical protein
MKTKKKGKQKVVKLRRSSTILIAAGLVLVVAALVLVLKNNISLSQYSAPVTSPPGNGILTIPIGQHDFGKVPLAGGIVSKSFPLVNIGEDDLTIFSLDTSCGCTSARIINDNESGPLFGMASHRKSPINWATVIKPGQQAQLVVFYDPTVHSDFRGPATRTVTVFSNDKFQTTKSVIIKVNQVE